MTYLLKDTEAKNSQGGIFCSKRRTIGQKKEKKEEY
jgi:hypothetical protein